MQSWFPFLMMGPKGVAWFCQVFLSVRFLCLMVPLPSYCTQSLCKPMASASLHQAPSVHSEAVQWHVKYNGTWRCIQFRSGDWRAVCGSKAAYPLHERTCRACGYVLPAEVGKKLLACNACWQVHYCNRSCQKQGWKEHRNVCDDALIEL